MREPCVTLKDVSLDIPLYNSRNRSLKRKLLDIARFRPECALENSFRALNCITRNFYEGDRVALIGKNGSGKTTL